MSWDLKIDWSTGDLTNEYVTGQDEILQRVRIRLWRHLGEWFVNTSAGLPWYRGPSTVLPGELTEATAILGSRNFRWADMWIRNEIAETQGVIRVIDFNTRFDNTRRIYSIRANIITEFGLPHVLSLDYNFGDVADAI